MKKKQMKKLAKQIANLEIQRTNASKEERNKIELKIMKISEDIDIEDMFILDEYIQEFISEKS